MASARLVLITIIATISFKYVCAIVKGLYMFLRKFRLNLTLMLFNIVVWLPCGRRFLENQRKKNVDEFERKVKSKRTNIVKTLPQQAWREDTIMARMKKGSQEA